MIRERAYAKVNLLLHVGPRRDDGLHAICSLFASVDLADELRIEEARAPRHEGGDVVVCPDVPEPNLVHRALEAFRTAVALDLPPLRVEIDKRIPVAGGLGGGSADAAAALRAANELAGRPLDAAGLGALGARVGADVPSQVVPGHAVVSGAGEHVEPVALAPMWLVLRPQPFGLSTAEVYREADRIESTRSQLDVGAVRTVAGTPADELAGVLENDLEPAALSLRPELRAVLGELADREALAARVTGSGPTAFGLFADRPAAERAAAALPGALVTAVREADRGHREAWAARATEARGR